MLCHWDLFSKRLWLKITVLCRVTNIQRGTKPATATLFKFYYEGFDKIRNTVGYQTTFNA